MDPAWYLALAAALLRQSDDIAFCAIRGDPACGCAGKADVQLLLLFEKESQR